MKSPITALALGLILSGAVAPAVSLACAFHTYLPERTVVDQLLETENVVVARADPADPFRYKAIRALQGTLDGAELPTLVDTTTRRRLAQNPNDLVLFTRDGGGYGPWKRLAYLDSDFQAVIETVMAGKQDWIMGEDLERFALAASLLDHANPDLRNLALAELDIAPYSILRDLDLAPSAELLLRDIWELSEIPRVPVRLLLLGFSPDPAAAKAIDAGLARAAESGNGERLGPLIMATVQQYGLAGVDRIAETVILNPAYPETSIEIAIEGLAIHAGAGDEGLRRHILGALTQAIAKRPEVMDKVARQFLNRYDFDMAPPLEQAMKAGNIRSAKVLIPVSTYVTLARQDNSQDYSAQ